MPLDAARFRHTMSQLVTGVTVVTAKVSRGRTLGITVSSVTSLSLEPPMLLVCIGRDAVIHDALLEAERFGVNVLAAGQRDLARRFADRERQRLEESEYTLSPGGVPVLPGALASIECRRRSRHEGGDHTIVTGILEWAVTGEGRPLCYLRGGYAELQAGG
jgi:flavin reductase (DIM6/NTAB) family NADH-FMN oxidoreductase RutF